MSLRNQINIRMFFIALVILSTGSMMAVWKAKQSVEDEITSSFQLVSTMLDFSVNQLGKANQFADSELFLNHISNIQEARHVRFDLLENGQIKNVNVLVEDQDNPPPAWFNSAINQDFPYLTKELNLPGDSERRIIITTDPRDETQEAWEEFITFLWSILPTLGILFLLINAVFNYIFKAVQNILSSLKKLTENKYDHHLPKYRINEFNDIAQGINTLAKSLNETRKSNKELIGHSLQIQELERETMAKELHDEMGQSIAAIKAMAVTAKYNPDDVTQATDHIVSICDHLSKIISSRMRTLHPLSLDELGLNDTLQNLVGEWNRNHPKTNVSLFISEDINKLSHDISIHIYRIVQECLTNIAKHAEATKVDVRIEPEDFKNILLSVKDNGTGFDKTLSKKGFGLRGIRERAESQGGLLAINSDLGQGSRISVMLPM
ncbi:MAG: ATP-binding protein [Neptuniibacter sp.]